MRLFYFHELLSWFVLRPTPPGKHLFEVFFLPFPAYWPKANDGKPYALFVGTALSEPTFFGNCFWAFGLIFIWCLCRRFTFIGCPGEGYAAFKRATVSGDCILATAGITSTATTG